MGNQIFGSMWRQGYGFDAEERSFGPYATRKEARKRIHRGRVSLRRAGLSEDWQIVAVTEKRQSGYFAVGHIAEIR